MCAHADFAKFIYKILDIYSQQKSYFNGIYRIYLKFDL